MRVAPAPLVAPVALVLALAAAACGGPGTSGAGPSPRPSDAGPRLHPLDAEARGWVDSVLAGLDTRERAAQLVVQWMPGAFVSPSAPAFETPRRWVEEDRIGGLYTSIGPPLAVAARVNELQARAEVPLLITSDFESGGPGMRIAHLYSLPGVIPMGGGTSFPPTMAFGAVGEERFAREYGRVTAAEARAVGVHLNFAPTLDVNSNPLNPIINTRSFGGDPELVARLGVAFIEGSREGGVMATAKHFPGHGDTRTDSHVELPVVDADRARLDTLELVPFRRAVEAGVTAVMTAHVSIPGLLGEGAPPATLSPEIMTGLLRDEMGFDGILFTDALSMAAVSDRWGAGEAAVRALEAGADVLLFPADVTAAVDAVSAAVEEGRVAPGRLERSVRKVLEAKARAGLHRDRFVDLDRVDDRVGTGPHLAFADTAATRSITVPRDRRGLLPLAPGARVLSLTVAPPRDLPAGRTLDATLRGLGHEVVPARIDDPGRAPWDSLSALAADVDAVSVGVYLPASAGSGAEALPAPFRAFFRSLASRRPTVLVSLGNPYLLSALPEAGTYVLAWGPREVSQRAAARALAGAEAVTGTLPIDLPPFHRVGEGLRIDARPAVADAPDRPGDPDEALPPVGQRVEARPATDDRWRRARELDRLRGGLPDVPMTVSFVEVEAGVTGADPAALARIDSVIRAAVADSAAPGVALAVGHAGELVRLRGYGTLDWAEDRPVTPGTIFDLASLTKVVATTTAVMILVDEGRLDLDDRVVEHLPWWSAGDPRKERVTVRQLLVHRAGLPPFRRWFTDHRGEDAYRDAIGAEPLQYDPGTRSVYSDIGLMTAGFIVEAVTGTSLDEFVAERIFEPLGMEETGFLPDPALLPRIAPTEVDTLWRHEHVRGVVHDENADAMGGVAGHAGLFSSAWDLATFARMMLGSGAVPPCEPAVGSGAACTRLRPDTVRIVSEAVVDRFTRRQAQGSSRALGWDTYGWEAPSGGPAETRAFGHTGFTGTSLRIYPALDLFVVLLTNRVNPTRDNDRHVPLRRAVHRLAVEAVTGRAPAPREGSGGP